MSSTEEPTPHGSESGAGAGGRDSNEDALAEIMEEDGTESSAVGKFVFFGMMLFIAPLLVVFLTYKMVFIGHYHLPQDKAALYSGLLGILTAYVIIALYIWCAYKEETQIARRVELLKKTK